MYEPPQSLVLNLKRFQQAGLAFIKNAKKVAFPLELSLDPYVVHRVPRAD
jgi:hypothetical protein